ncbi:MAG: glycosyltransferase family 2 protein [Elusimicrobia bacterium]|nr:glycosyltransferase family 2 protein [Elusimicrobiota bacterium]
MKVTLVLYVLNEIGALRVVLPRIKREWYDELIAIDGGSTDGSVEYLRENGCAVYRQKRPSWSGAYREAYERAEGEVIVDFSPDGNSVPEVIPALTRKLEEGYDMVIASRYTGGAKSEDDSPLTRFGNFMFTAMINLLYGTRYTDSLVIFRAYTRSLLERGGLLERDLDQCVTALLDIRCAKIKARCADVPGDEPARLSGVSKMNPLLDGLRVLAVILKELVYRDIEAASRRPIRW